MIPLSAIIRSAKGWGDSMRIRAGRLVVGALGLIFGGAGWAGAAGPFQANAEPLQVNADPVPVNPHATPEARALLKYIASISGQGILTGQHNYPNVGSRYTDLAYDLTGKYPGLFGEDFGFSAGDDKDSVLSRPAMIAEAERQWRNGAVIALTWHEVRPTEDEPVTFHDSVQGKLTDYEWKELLTPGSPLNRRWCAQVDVVAGYLRRLQDAHVPVLFRAYHEMNGNWFWWGGRPGKDGSAAMYRMIYDRFVNVHHLDNLVWVWNVNAPSGNAGSIADYYPGAAYADVVSMDIYGAFQQDYYDSMLTVAAGKPIALAEVGGLPSVEVLEKQPRWAYFMTWSEFIQEANPLELANAVFHAPRAINRDDARLTGAMAAIRKGTEERASGKVDADPVTAGATSEAKALLGQLVGAGGSAVLSGEFGRADTASAVMEATGRRPAIFATDLGANGAEHQEAVQAALEAHKRQQVVSLSWRPLRPDDAARNDTAGLTEYEWDELVTPGTGLNLRWAAQVDEAAKALKELQKTGVAVLWNPYPEGNGKRYWWAGRKGVNGSAELYRMLFARLTEKDEIKNLIWVWQAAGPGFGASNAGPSEVGAFSDYFPGYLYTDALELSVRGGPGRSRMDGLLAQFALGKPIGVEFTGSVPGPEAVAGQARWNWFVVDAQGAAADAGRDAGLKALFSDARVSSLAAQ